MTDPSDNPTETPETGDNPAGKSGACPNCADPHEVADVFCENCGYDFLSGAMPAPLAGESDPGASADGDAAADADPPPPEAPITATATVGVDLDYFALMAPDGGVDAPPTDFTTVDVPLRGDDVLIGRQSVSRGVFPDLDLLDITGDPAVSMRHASLRRAADDEWTITDLNSTNGTSVGGTGSAIAAGDPTPLPYGTVVYLGAFTTITLTAADSRDADSLDADSRKADSLEDRAP